MWKGNKLLGFALWLMFILSLLIIPITCYAGQDDEGNEAFVSPVNLYPKVEELAGIGAKIEQNRDQYLKKRGWELGQSTHNPGGAKNFSIMTYLKLGPRWIARLIWKNVFQFLQKKFLTLEKRILIGY
jgi:hypothetical protein